MPVISEFYRIIIRMFYNDHAPLHFHAIYGEFELIVGVSPIKLLDGKAPNRVKSMVLEWAALHQTELIEIGDAAASQNSHHRLSLWNKPGVVANALHHRKRHTVTKASAAFDLYRWV